MRTVQTPLHPLQPAPTFPSPFSLLHKTRAPDLLLTRPASTAQTSSGNARSIIALFNNLLYGTAISLALAIGYYQTTDTRASIYHFHPSLLRCIYEDAEDAHNAGNRWLKTLHRFGLHPRERAGDKDKRSVRRGASTYHLALSAQPYMADSEARSLAILSQIPLAPLPASVRLLTS